MTFKEIIESHTWFPLSRETINWLCWYPPFENGSFDLWPASCPNEAHSHHAYNGGLALHTQEVIETAMGANQWDHDDTVLVVAGLFHDVGKIWDYEKTGYPSEGSPMWHKTTHHKMVRHVSRSFSEFVKHHSLFPNHGLSPEQIENIEHCILSHHGRREWGSPVEPVTPEALLLHQADYFSAHFGKGR